MGFNSVMTGIIHMVSLSTYDVIDEFSLVLAVSSIAVTDLIPL